MRRVPRWPQHIANWLQVLRPMLRHRYPVVVGGLLGCQAIDQEQATVKGLARLAPQQMAEWHLRRLLTAADWHWRVLLWGCADHVIATLPPPADGVCDWVADSTLPEQTGQKPPLAKQGRLHAYAPSLFGLHLVVVMLYWGNYRIPSACAIVRRTAPSRYRSEPRRFRWRLARFRRPPGAALVVGVAEAAGASKANIQLIRPRGDGFVRALARTGCGANGQALKELVPHLPKPRYRRCGVPVDEPGRRRTSWTSVKRARLRQGGEVTRVLSKPRRHEGPKQTKILVTPLPHVTARQVVASSRRRGSAERLIKAWKGAMGLGLPQVTKAPPRVERSVAIAMLASLRLLKFHAQDIPERGSWRMCTLKRNVTWQIAQTQLERSVEQRLRKRLLVFK